MLNRPDGLIFDMDGTLVLSEQYHRLSWNEPLAELGIAIDDGIYAEHFAGKPGMNIIREYCGLVGDDAQALYARVHEAYWVLAHDQLEPLEGLIGFLDATGEMPRAVCTSAQRAAATRMLDILGIAEYFDAIVTATDVDQGKPHPEPFELAARLIGVAPTRSVAFEDSSSGLISARAAGMFCIGVGEGVHRYEQLADVWIHDFTDPNLAALCRN